MKKIGFILDSFSCLTETEANQKNYYFIPLRVDLDDKIYEDGIDFNQKDLLELIAKSQTYKTSLPKLTTIEEIFQKASKENDYVIYFPINSSLSGTFSAAKTISQDFNNIYVIDNNFVGIQYEKVIQKIQQMNQNGANFEEILNFINNIQDQFLTYILPLDLKYAINGGRVNGIKKFFLLGMSKLKLMPFLRFSNNEVVNAGVGRNIKSVITQIIEKILEFTKSTTNELKDKFDLTFIYGIDNKFNNEVINIAKENDLEIINSQINSSIIAIHTGPDALALSIMPKF
ncbi:DegV family protein [Mycoplasmopsis gallinarum]|uniref:DegV family protein n=1 Tax=Mycoplasmopsis gallinarum TaxID=29557 RepID=UPI000487848F|nr:DegV family protein [Mycoplasmopsis gallinarum]